MRNDTRPIVVKTDQRQNQGYSDENFERGNRNQNNNQRQNNNNQRQNNNNQQNNQSRNNNDMQRQNNQPRALSNNAISTEFYQKVGVFYLNEATFYIRLQEFYDRFGNPIDLTRRPIPAGTEPAGFIYVDRGADGMYANFIANRQEHRPTWEVINEHALKFEHGLHEWMVWLSEHEGKKQRPSRTVRNKNEVVILERPSLPLWVKVILISVLITVIIIVIALINMGT